MYRRTGGPVFWDFWDRFVCFTIQNCRGKPQDFCVFIVIWCKCSVNNAILVTLHVYGIRTVVTAGPCFGILRFHGFWFYNIGRMYIYLRLQVCIISVVVWKDGIFSRFAKKTSFHYKNVVSLYASPLPLLSPSFGSSGFWIVDVGSWYS